MESQSRCGINQTGITIYMKRLKWLSGALAALMMLAGCSKDNSADVSDLLRTIPADASVVMVMDLKSMLEKADCTVSGGDLKPGKELAKLIESSKEGDMKSTLEQFKESGVEWSGAALFVEGYNTYLTGFLNDSGKFKALMEKKFNEKYSSGEISMCGNTAVNGDRFWICLNSNNTIVENDIRHFTSLSEKQSILSNESVGKLQTLTSDIAGWGDIKGVLNLAGLDFTQRAVYTMALETAFVDAVELEWNVNIDKDACVAELTLLNSKGGIAKFNFPVEKIDETVVKNLNTSAEGFAAIAVSRKMLEQLKEQTSKEGFSLLGAMVNMMGSVDGTIAAAMGDDDAATGIITTTGHGTTDLSDALSQWGFTVNKEGTDLKFSRGNVSGPLSAADAAGMLKGSVAGLVLTDEGSGWVSRFKSVAVTFRSDKGGLKGVVTVKGKDPKRKFLLSLIAD